MLGVMIIDFIGFELRQEFMLLEIKSYKDRIEK